ncbi:hypothetical protein OROGR_005099 [Orobanche gracilis]
MGNQKQKWTAEEEEALKAGVAKHGTGKWKNILVDSEFAPKLFNRSNVDLKDKWRNMVFYHGQGCKDSATTPTGQACVSSVVAPKIPNNYPVFCSKEKANGHPSRGPQNTKNISKYNKMILEALSSLKDPSGSDIGAIVGFIEQKYEVPQNFRKLLSSKLRRLVLQEKLEKVLQCYKIKDAALGTKTPSPKQKDVRTKAPLLQQYSLTISGESEAVEDAAETAARWVVEAENKAFLMSKALEEYERVSRMAGDADTMLTLAKELYV